MNGPPILASSNTLRDNFKQELNSDVNVSSTIASQRFGASPARGNEMSLDKITPEFAAKIVKNFVLPMFEQSAKARVGKRLGQKETLIQSGGIYNELKLSE